MAIAEASSLPCAAVAAASIGAAVLAVAVASARRMEPKLLRAQVSGDGLGHDRAHFVDVDANSMPMEALLALAEGFAAPQLVQIVVRQCFTKVDTTAGTT